MSIREIGANEENVLESPVEISAEVTGKLCQQIQHGFKSQASGPLKESKNNINDFVL